jgi:DNA repair exonuclease SbcCD ATPase subunit
MINANTKVEDIYKQIEIYSNDIEIYNKNIQNILINEEINKQIEMCRLELTKYNMKQKELITKLSECNFNIRNLEEKIIQIQQTETEIDNLSKELEIYRVLSSMVSINGLQLYLLDKYLDKISQRINNILEPFIHKNIKLVLHKDRIDMVIYQKMSKETEIKTKTEEKQIYTLSGMENFMLDLSLIVIINQISEIPQSNILFIDESISVLDKNRLENISELFIFIKQYFKQTYMITHMKQVKSQIDYNLEINKLNDFSLIYNVANVMVLKLNKMKDHNSNKDNMNDTNNEMTEENIINNMTDQKEKDKEKEEIDGEIKPIVSKKKISIRKTDKLSNILSTA